MNAAGSQLHGGITGARGCWPAEVTPGVACKPASSRLLMQSTPVPPALDLPARLDKLLGLAVQLVDTKAEARLLHDEHPQGAVQHGGQQTAISDHLGSWGLGKLCVCLS